MKVVFGRVAGTTWWAAVPPMMPLPVSQVFPCQPKGPGTWIRFIILWWRLWWSKRWRCLWESQCDPTCLLECLNTNLKPGPETHENIQRKRVWFASSTFYSSACSGLVQGAISAAREGLTCSLRQGLMHLLNFATAVEASSLCSDSSSKLQFTSFHH